MTIRVADGARDAAVDAVTNRADAGSAAGLMRIYTGAQPSDADDAATGTLLATVTLQDPAFTSGGTGVNTLSDPGAVTGSNAGTAGWFRILDSDLNKVFDGSCGLSGSGADLILSNTVIAVGQTVDILSGGTVTMPAG